MTTRSKLLRFAPAMVAGAAVVLAAFGTPGARAYHTNFQGACTNEYSDESSAYRFQARIYAEIGTREGYQWGGGCWNDDDIDNSPGDPTQDPNTRGEGGDCSGFAFKVWRERDSSSDAGFRYHFRMRKIHGPYVADSFRTGAGAPNTTIARSSAISMDAFASSTHIGLVYQANTAYNTDQIVEAKCEACGTNFWSETYRGNSAYGGVRRIGWAG
jgi:hypothetical protein